MPTKHCAFANCTSDSRYPQDGVSFVPFVKPNVDMKKCLKWIHACRKVNFGPENINKYSYICSKHFIGDKGLTAENPDPVPATASKIPNARPTKRRSEPVDSQTSAKQQRLLPGNDKENKYRHKSDIFLARFDNNGQSNEIENELWNAVDETVHEPADQMASIAEEENVQETSSTKDIECQTCYEVESVFIKKLQKEIELLKGKIEYTTLRVESCKENPKKFHFYTGLSHEQFVVLWKFLGPPTSFTLQMWQTNSKSGSQVGRHKTYSLSLENQLFLTLVRLRCGFLVEDLSYRFGVSAPQICKITTTWIQIIYMQFKKLNIFPSAESARKKGLPKAFRKFKNVRVVIDGFEIGIQRSKDYRQQGNTYSTYKSHNAVKFLVGIVPTGGCCFLSEVYEGCISDREIVKKSGFLDQLHKQDLVLADRGFNITDLCNKIGCSVLIPPFLKGRAKFTKQEVRQTRDIAAARIHVERFIGRMKQFRILQRVIPKTMLPIISQVVFVIGMLVNFQPPLVE